MIELVNAIALQIRTHSTAFAFSLYVTNLLMLFNDCYRLRMLYDAGKITKHVYNSEMDRKRQRSLWVVIVIVVFSTALKTLMN